MFTTSSTIGSVVLWIAQLGNSSIGPNLRQFSPMPRSPRRWCQWSCDLKPTPAAPPVLLLADDVSSSESSDGDDDSDGTTSGDDTDVMEVKPVASSTPKPPALTITPVSSTPSHPIGSLHHLLQRRYARPPPPHQHLDPAYLSLN